MKRNKCILLINSSQTFMNYSARILERVGYCVRCAEGIDKAREQLVDFVPDGIILENELPDGIGLAFCHELRQASSVPVMFVSGSKDDELPALQTGANDFLMKPYNFEIMKARINIMLNKKINLSSAPESDAASPSQAEGAQQQAEPDTAAASAKKKVGFKNTYYTYFAAAACFMLVLLGAAALAIDNYGTDYVEIPDGQVPTSETPFVKENDDILCDDEDPEDSED